MKILRLKSGVKRRSSQLLQLKRFLQNDYLLSKSSPTFVEFFVFPLLCKKADTMEILANVII